MAASRSSRRAAGLGKVNINGFGERNNRGVFALEALTANYTRARGVRDAQAPPHRARRWGARMRVSEIGFGGPNINRAILDMTVFEVGFASTGQEAGQLWRSRGSPDLGSGGRKWIRHGCDGNCRIDGGA